MGRGAALALAVALVASCGDDGSGSPTATLEPGPTTERTTTTLSPEDEVEAAYLESWEVYADAVLRLDDSRLSDRYAGRALEIVMEDVAKLRADNTPVRVDVEHNYEIELAEDVARVVDHYTNHSVLLDARSHEPIEEDPNERVDELYLLQQIEGKWHVVSISAP